MSTQIQPAISFPILSRLDCKGCQLRPLSHGLLQPEGRGDNKVLLVGEAAGANEARESLPFRPSGDAGAILTRALNRAGLDRADFAIHNIVSCQPPRNELEGEPYEWPAIEHCRRHFDKVIEKFRPRAIVALGSVPLKALTGLAGKHKTIFSLRGYPLHSDRYDLPVIPTLHPAFIARGAKQFYGVLIRDIGYALEIARDGVKRDTKNYIETPAVDDARSWLYRVQESDQSIPIVPDIETLQSLKDSDEAEELTDANPDWNQITQIQFSVRSHTAICLPYKDGYKEIAREIMALSNPKWGWNTRTFDYPLMLKNDFVINGEQIDLMNAWHHLQPDLPKKLQFVTSFYAPEIGPWKHLSNEDPTFYGCVDVDAPQRIGAKLFNQLRKANIYEVRDRDDNPCGGWYHHVHRLTNEVLDKMQRRGMPVDAKRQAELYKFIAGRMSEIDAQIQPRVPDAIKQYHPEFGFVREPEDKTGLILRTFNAPITSIDSVWCEECFGRGRVEGKRPGKTKKCPKCKGEGSYKRKGEKVIQPIDRWCEPIKFTVNGPHGLLRYMQYRGHKIPKSRITRRPTTNDEALERLYLTTGDQLYKLAIDYRKLGKTASTYIWPTTNGFVHTTFTTNPATGQISSVRPNIQNITSPKHESGTELQLMAEKIRATVKAKDGFLIGEADYSGYHIVSLGVLCGDPNLVRLARIDAHSFITAYVLKLDGRDKLLDLPDDELAQRLAVIKKAHKSVRNDKVKPCLLGINLGMGPDKFFAEINKRGTAKMTLNECVILHKAIHTLFPKISEFQNDSRKRAHSKTFIRSPYGYLRRFWEVYKWSLTDNRWVPGDSFNDAVAFDVQNLAHGKLKDAMLELESTGLADRYGMFNQIHDSLKFHFKIEDLADWKRDVLAIMQKPTTVFTHPDSAPDGFWCGVELKAGPDWISMEDV